ncbi:MAG: hypothetical protein MR409_01555 [Lachnospiraceae bacterium]|nr:hypothetical protein [Lachnospiraceae bacterium]
MPDFSSAALSSINDATASPRSTALQMNIYPALFYQISTCQYTSNDIDGLVTASNDGSKVTIIHDTDGADNDVTFSSTFVKGSSK